MIYDLAQSKLQQKTENRDLFLSTHCLSILNWKLPWIKNQNWIVRFPKIQSLFGLNYSDQRGDRETVVWTHTEVLINVKWSASLESIFQQTMRIVFNDQSWCCQSTTNMASSAAGEAGLCFDWPTTLPRVNLFQAESMVTDVPHIITHEYYYPVCVCVCVWGGRQRDE